MHFVKKSSLALILCAAASVPALAATQSVPININGTFSNATQPCQNAKFEGNVNFAAVNTLVSVGDETEFRSMGSYGLSCEYPTEATLTFTSGPSAKSPEVFKTSSDAFGVKLKVNSIEVTPGKNEIIKIGRGTNYFSIATKIRRVAANGVNDFGDHNFNITGTLAVNYL